MGTHLQDEDGSMRSVLNEVLPLLFVSLKLSCSVLTSSQKQLLAELTSLDDFLRFDKDQELLVNAEIETALDAHSRLQAVYKQVEFITRVYALDSRKYKKQC